MRENLSPKLVFWYGKKLYVLNVMFSWQMHVTPVGSVYLFDKYQYQTNRLSIKIDGYHQVLDGLDI